MRRSARGSLSLEYVIVAPLFLLVLALIWAYARSVELEGRLDAGTRDAARVVGESPNLSLPAVQKLVEKTVQSALGNPDGGCNAGTVNVPPVQSIDPTTGQPRGGAYVEPGDTVVVTVSCPYHVYDLGLPIPTTFTARSQFASMVDPNRTAPSATVTLAPSGSPVPISSSAEAPTGSATPIVPGSPGAPGSTSVPGLPSSTPSPGVPSAPPSSPVASP